MIEQMQKSFARWIYYEVFIRLTKWIPDVPYLKMVYRIRLGRKLDIENPRRLTEKLQWLKIHGRKPIYTKMVDKHDMKEFIAEKLGDGYTIPAIGVWDHFDDINFDSLPDQFVLKCTHNSGCYVVCKGKAAFEQKAAKKKLNKGLKYNYFWNSREWPYKDVKPRILAEPFIDTLGNDDSVEYKMTCFNGKLAFGTICVGPAHVKLNQRSNDFYDKDFNFIPVQTFNRNSKHPITERPAVWDELVRISEILSGGGTVSACRLLCD